MSEQDRKAIIRSLYERLKEIQDNPDPKPSQQEQPPEEPQKGGIEIAKWSGWVAVLLTIIYHQYPFVAKPQLSVIADHSTFTIPDKMKSDLSTLMTPSGKISYSDLIGYLGISARNISDIEAQNVSLRIEGAEGLAQIEWDNGEKKMIEFKNVIPIGNVPVETGFSVSAWVNQELSPKSDVKFSNNVGRQQITLPGEVTGISFYWLIPTGVICIFVGTYVAYLASKPEVDRLRQEVKATRTRESVIFTMRDWLDAWSANEAKKPKSDGPIPGT